MIMMMKRERNAKNIYMYMKVSGGEECKRTRRGGGEGGGCEGEGVAPRQFQSRVQLSTRNPRNVKLVCDRFKERPAPRVLFVNIIINFFFFLSR